jgi:hypothetical protein
MPVVRSSELESGTSTTSFTPSNTTAEPNRPDVVRVAPLSVPVLPRPDESVAVETPLASSKPYAATGPVWADAVCSATTSPAKASEAAAARKSGCTVLRSFFDRAKDEPPAPDRG